MSPLRTPQFRRKKRRNEKSMVCRNRPQSSLPSHSLQISTEQIFMRAHPIARLSCFYHVIGIEIKVTWCHPKKSWQNVCFNVLDEAKQFPKTNLTYTNPYTNQDWNSMLVVSNKCSGWADWSIWLENIESHCYKLVQGFRAEILEMTFSFPKFWAVSWRFRVPVLSVNHFVSKRFQKHISVWN